MEDVLLLQQNCVIVLKHDGVIKYIKTIRYRASDCKLIINNCNLTESTIVRTAAFKSEYDVTCSSLDNSITKSVLETILTYRKTDIQKLCGKGEC